MIRKLFILAGAGFVLSLACLAGTAVMVRHDLKGDGFNLFDRQLGEHVRIATSGTPQPLISKTLAFKASDFLGIDVPAEVTFTQGETQSLSVTGSKDLVERLRYQDGRLYLTPGDKVVKGVNLKLVGNRVETHPIGGELKIAITAPAIKRFDITGAGDVKITGFDQPELSLNISGAGKVEAEGRAKALKLNISGVGNADLANLKLTDADVHISGMGDADIAATGTVRLDISGTGNINLKTRPATLEKRISGMGSINEED
jgi:hypothetical protein